VVENCHQAAAAESDLIRKSQNSLVMLTNNSDVATVLKYKEFKPFYTISERDTDKQS